MPLGSPQRGRGKVQVCAVVAVARGITPAWAGKSRTRHRPEHRCRDHSRMGGEKQDGHSQAPWNWGSPPRGRGKGGAGALILGQIGITPAWAGKSCGRCPAGRCSGDHPRVGGEKHAAPVSWMWSAGSPPRGRGKACRHAQLDNQGRITPAWAGKRAVEAALILQR